MPPQTVPQKAAKPATQLPPIAGGPWGVTRAYEYCVELAGKNNEDYPVATWLLPKSVRNHFATIYAFARTAEDFARRPPSGRSVRPSRRDFSMLGKTRSPPRTMEKPSIRCSSR